MSTLELIAHHELLVRPALFSRGWVAGEFRGITGHTMPHAICKDGTEWQGESIEEAVAKCVNAIETGEINPQWQGTKNAFPDL